MDSIDENLPLKDVLLVEDDQELCVLIEGILLKMGIKSVSCKNYKEAVNHLLSYRFSLVLTDINLGDSTGLDILAYVKQNKPTVRVVLMTGFLEDTDIHDALELGVFGFLAKPLSKKEIQKIIKNALGNKPEDKITDLDYARVDIEDFLSGKVLNFPVYIRLKDSRFLKIAHSGTEIDIERINQLKEKRIQELWIDKDDLPAYLALNEKILHAKTNWNSANKVKFLNHLAEISYESMRLLELSDSSVRYCLDSINILTREVTKLNGTLPLLSPFFPGGEVRASKMAVNGASFSLIIAAVLGWTSEKTLHALSLGAFFRDISLTSEEFNFSQLYEKNPNFERAHYKAHPNRSVEILEKLGGFPKEALTIIEQHHEDGSANGFPNKLSKSVIFAPSLIVNYVDKMLFFMMENAHLPAEEMKKNVLNFLQNSLRDTHDEKATALITFIKHGDIQKAQREIERLKKIG
ncbi:MAG: response regulator [Halobacteriovoraceae bacterium]|nr:response regulator [Halobacteriovoraceae bacterium]